MELENSTRLSKSHKLEINKCKGLISTLDPTCEGTFGEIRRWWPRLRCIEARNVTSATMKGENPGRQRKVKRMQNEERLFSRSNFAGRALATSKNPTISRGPGQIGYRDEFQFKGGKRRLIVLQSRRKETITRPVLGKRGTPIPVTMKLIEKGLIGRAEEFVLGAGATGHDTLGGGGPPRGCTEEIKVPAGNRVKIEVKRGKGVGP